MILLISTQVALIAAGLIFLLALLLGVWKYYEMAISATGHAHIYIDIAHRAALMYSFATAMIAAFVQFSFWSVWVNLAALGVLLFFFLGAIASYMWHGYVKDTDNQLHPHSVTMFVAMTALIIGEVGGFALILLGFVVEQITR